ncbi:peptidase [Anopheles sinensis]|uniref:Peptidase n=1 Tax=Anopheles sinensis TaxID=74873 RepID=A0A084WLD1_ANOSI|nr:peptidase [Anopheles sinensis]
MEMGLPAMHLAFKNATAHIGGPEGSWVDRDPVVFPRQATVNKPRSKAFGGKDTKRTTPHAGSAKPVNGVGTVGREQTRKQKSKTAFTALLMVAGSLLLLLQGGATMQNVPKTSVRKERMLDGPIRNEQRISPDARQLFSSPCTKVL